MKKQDKIFTVDNLTAQLREAKSIILADYRGLTVAQMSQLREQIKKNGGALTVVKNTLLCRALQNLGLAIEAEGIAGPTAIVIATQDELAPLKVMANFAKNAGLPTFKSGIWEGRIIAKEQVERLSLLPAKEELLRQLTGVLTSPTIRLVQVVVNNPRKFILLLRKMEGVNRKLKIKNDPFGKLRVILSKVER